VSLESGSAGDNVFTVGPDNDSGESDSEEVERLSRKSSNVTSRTKSPNNPRGRSGDYLHSSSPSKDSVFGDYRRQMMTTRGAATSKDADKSTVPLLSDVQSNNQFSSVKSGERSGMNPISSPSNVGGSVCSVDSNYQDDEQNRYFLERGSSWTQSRDSLDQSKPMFQLNSPQSSRSVSLVSLFSSSGQPKRKDVDTVRVEMGTDGGGLQSGAEEGNTLQEKVLQEKAAKQKNPLFVTYVDIDQKDRDPSGSHV